MTDLRGRFALVTGSTRGIGWAITQALAKAGARVAVHGIEPGEAAARAAGLAPGTPTSTADLMRQDGVAQLARDIGAAPDILVICAAIEHLADWSQLMQSQIAAQDAINLHATVRLLQTFVPPMLGKGWGRVVAIGSVQEERPNASHFYYVATKAAQTSMILNLARANRVPGVTFNVLRPGAIETDRNRAVLADPAYRAAVLERIPLGRLGAADDCVGAALLLCSDAGAYINGAILSVDGGLRL